VGVFSSGLDRYLNRDDITLKQSSAETASATGSGVELGDKASMALIVDVTAATGTSPTLLVTVEGSNDGSVWYTLAKIGANGVVYGDVAAAPSNFTTAATVRAVVPAARFVRSKSTIGGTTPSFTYSVAGSAA